MFRINKLALIMLVLIFIAVGVLSGFAVAVHPYTCRECAQSRTTCPELAKLQEVMRQLGGFLLLSAGVMLIAFSLKPIVQFAQTWRQSSLVVWKTRMNN